MTKDPFATLVAMRPDPDPGERWPRDQRAAARDRIAAGAAAAPGAPARRRRGIVTLAATLCTAGGIGVAAATGVMPQVFTDHYSHWRGPGAPGSVTVDPGDARRIASLPGPAGTVFGVLVAGHESGKRCVTSIFESPESAAQPGPTEFVDLGNRCGAGAETEGVFGQGAGTFVVGAFGTDGIGAALPDAYTFDAAAGAAVRADLHTSDGRVWPTVLADGSFFGWYPVPAAGSSRTVLVGYAADGTVVGRLEVGPNN